VSTVPDGLNIRIAYVKFPRYLPSMVASILGAHFISFGWLYQTWAYYILGVFVSEVPIILLFFFEKNGFVIGPFCFGACLIAGSFFLLP
jgi:hypothetical protein